MIQYVRNFVSNESGATGMEYALLASGISIGIVVSVATLGGNVEGMFTDVSAAVNFTSK